MMYDYDVIFIGSGHACNHGAMMLQMAGKIVAMVEKDKLGGTCTNYGCDAKIILDGPFEFKDALKRYEDLDVKNTEINWTKLMEYKKEILSGFQPLIGGMFENMGIDIIRGFGCLKDAHTVDVDGKEYTADYIVIGTGERDSKLDIEGSEYIKTSKDFLDLDEMPDSIVFIGTGIITMEFASMAVDLGKKVTMISHGDKALRAYPQKYVTKLISKMQSQGVEFEWNQDVSKVIKTDSGLKLITEKGLEVECDYIVEGTGRVANFENLGLEKLGIKASRKGIEVNDHMQTAVSNIYASGDIVFKKIPKLTPTAEFESNYIAAQIIGLSDDAISYPPIPNLVFTLPRIAQVGVSVDEAGDDYRIVEVPYGQTQEWVNNKETDAEMTFIFDGDDYLVGAAIYSSEAAMMIDFLTLIINKKITASELSQMIFAFPTQTYSLVSELKPHLKQ